MRTTIVDPRKYQKLVLAKALEVYATTGMSVNRLYTPRNMMRTASQLLNREFKPRDYVGAAKALRE
jgi:hypothetical protein